MQREGRARREPVAERGGKRLEKGKEKPKLKRKRKQGGVTK